MRNFLSFVAVCGVFFPLWASATCVSTHEDLKELTEADFSGAWTETSESDGKPLLIRMSNENDQLYFVFEKSHEGIWAEGQVVVCSDKDGLIVKLAAKDIRIGAKAPLLIKMGMKGGAQFKLKIHSNDSMHVSASGWSGDFVPLHKK